jgi:uncharacterized membrane protein YjgN (DUF898 family)
MAVKRYRITCHLDFWSVVWHQLKWLLVTVLTLGLAAPLFAYFFIKYIVDRTEIVEE